MRVNHVVEVTLKSTRPSLPNNKPVQNIELSRKPPQHARSGTSLAGQRRHMKRDSLARAVTHAEMGERTAMTMIRHPQGYNDDVAIGKMFKRMTKQSNELQYK